MEDKQEKDVTAATRDAMLREQSDFIQAAAEQFGNAQALVSENNRLHQQVFQEVFLPMFLGQPNTRYPDIKSGNWVTFAGGVHRRVDIYDNSNKKVLTVPSLMQNTLVQPINGKTEVDMHFVAEQARLYSGTLPIVGQNYLSVELTKRASLMRNSDAPNEALQAVAEWMKIFEYFGVVAPQAAQGTTGPSNPPEDPGYEDVAP